MRVPFRVGFFSVSATFSTRKRGPGPKRGEVGQAVDASETVVRGRRARSRSRNGTQDLSGVQVDSIRFAFELLAPGTLVEGAALEIEEPPAVCVCADCNARTDLDELCLECPVCAGHDISIDGGREMLLQTIDIDEE